ncbi:MAG: glycosyltransferase family 4 protein [Scytonematopsis contorta HA4267-MV1]|jgi:glycosyltransferase involved in cell wall biosynthesis|nr:glycosyltransferase family 4 protein [Scytonematopsis contorta HA4267-MV1]
MKILHITNDVQEIGNGIINVAVDLACLQAKDGHDVAFASAGGEYEVLLAGYGVKHFHLNQKRTPLNILKAAVDYRLILQKFQPDIVHVHMMTGAVLALSLRFGNEYSVVSTLHNEFQRSSIIMGLADRVIAVSQAVANSISKWGISTEKIRVVPNGVLDSPRNCHKKDWTAENLKHPSIVTVSGMYRRKGVGELIEAFAAIAGDFPDAHLYLVGDGPELESLQEQASLTAFAERIHFEGFQREPQKYLLSTDIFVMASYSESFGLAIAEARTVGDSAIIASNVGGIPETLNGGQAGILVPPKNSQVLAITMKELLNNPEKLQWWKKQASSNLEWLSLHRVHRDTIRVYREFACSSARDEAVPKFASME